MLIDPRSICDEDLLANLRASLAIGLPACRKALADHDEAWRGADTARAALQFWEFVEKQLADDPAELCQMVRAWHAMGHET